MLGFAIDIGPFCRISSSANSSASSSANSAPIRPTQSSEPVSTIAAISPLSALIYVKNYIVGASSSIKGKSRILDFAREEILKYIYICCRV